jgi:hypothetical protein
VQNFSQNTWKEWVRWIRTCRCEENVNVYHKEIILAFGLGSTESQFHYLPVKHQPWEFYGFIQSLHIHFWIVL